MDPFTRIAELRAEERPFALATITWRRAPSSGKQGSRAIIHPDGVVEGWMGGACSQPTLVKIALETLQTGKAQLVLLGEDAQRDDVTSVPMACASEGAMEVYMEPVLPMPHIHIVGSSPMTETLKELAATLGWRATTRDDTDMGDIGPGTHVVVATQGHFDETAIEAALSTPAATIGVVASEKRAGAVNEWLREAGISDEQLSRVKAPAGLDLGPTDHAGIAVAILAELVSRQSQAYPAIAGVVVPEQATDPVCGMSVDIATAKWTWDLDSDTYYFCAPGCRKAFSTDPAGFLS